MYKLKFIRGRSYNGYGIKVSNIKPLIVVDNEYKYNQLLATKRFELIEVSESKKEITKSTLPNPSETPNDQWTVPQLREYANVNGIELTGLQNKSDILAKIEEVISQGDNVPDFGEE